MATYYSRATGNWASNTSWSTVSHAGEAATAFPVSGDLAYIGGTNKITVAAAAAVKTLYLGGSDDTKGELVLDADLTFDNAANSGLIIKAGAANTFASNATSAAPRSMTSAGGSSPTHYWTITVYDQTTIPDTRTLTFDFVEMTGNKWYIGNDDYFLNTNDGTAASGTITSITAPVPAPQLRVHYVDGRTTSRVYQEGTHAGACTVSGRIPWNSWKQHIIADLIRSKKRISFFSRFTHLPLCRIERATFRPSDGVYADFSITLIEDR